MGVSAPKATGIAAWKPGWDSLQSPDDSAPGHKEEQQALQEVRAQMDGTGAPDKQKVLDTFHAWDTEGKGKITQEKFLQIFRDISSGVSQADVLALFKHV